MHLLHNVSKISHLSSGTLCVCFLPTLVLHLAQSNGIFLVFHNRSLYVTCISSACQTPSTPPLHHTHPCQHQSQPWYSPQIFPTKTNRHRTFIFNFNLPGGRLLKQKKTTMVPNRSPILAPQMPSFWKCNGALTAHAWSLTWRIGPTDGMLAKSDSVIWIWDGSDGHENDHLMIKNNHLIYIDGWTWWI